MSHLFRVWAPNAVAVEVVVDGARHPMATSAGGWFESAVDGAGPGSRYGFSLDGGVPRPDPRSPSQPDGIDGLSEVIDHGAFEWTDNGWRGIPVASAVIYELHVGTFTDGGTFESAIEQLAHLVDLGVDAVELMPVNGFPGARGWGYDGVALFAPPTHTADPAG
jgi:maltooligosyltrehalose trehalohydrolase